MASGNPTKEFNRTKKLHLRQSHFRTVLSRVLILILISLSVTVTRAQDDEFDTSDQSTDLSLEEKTNPAETQSDATTSAPPPIQDEFLDSENLQKPMDELKVETSPVVETPIVEVPVETQSDEKNQVEVRDEYVPLVDVKAAYTSTTPYRHRRDRWGWMFSVNGENTFFSDFTSGIDSAFYEDLFGTEDLTIANVELEFRYNFLLGGLSLSLNYGNGSIEDDRTGELRKLEITKTAAGLTLYFDTLMKEPYVVPYVGGQLWKMGLSETNATTEIEYNKETSLGMAVKVGLLFQLNWLDPESALAGYQDNRIQNTYLDVFVTQYGETQGETDPNTATDFNWGAGLKVEF